MARAVGNALHKNTDPEHIPCYRVVNSKGELAAEFVFGGAGKQADMLEADGIVLENGRVNLKSTASTWKRCWHSGSWSTTEKQDAQNSERPERQRKMSVSVFHYVWLIKLENTIISH